MTTKTAFTPAPVPRNSRTRMRTAAVLSAFGMIPAVVLVGLAVAGSERFSRCLTYGDYYTDCASHGASATQMSWALWAAGLAFVFVLAVPDRARRAKEMRAAGLWIQILAEVAFVAMIGSNA
ncbi:MULTISPECIES: hypothetical protein [unclassified Streptomyces]|uniref:hypothetical protein n=1 Tax=unclassified Streptomyces TaxID=2593676 RepID=UPI0033E9BC6F